ncbi:phage tail assembly chaperone [Sphingomonas sp. CARO-RG-8B-R24-01]|uniref:phage tail assembly chaperone n=1 Tax=Sphingomonas sp. CARO-RG-8B-R24-01 TaxID=2914831 RepID=UPI001F5620FE|nr:phage tail assembly chaperone [Sphingomonas sp. CARO-RG-8B-R24-01]
MERFADVSARLAGLAGAVLGWSPDTFWRATPAELVTVVTVLTGGASGIAPPDAATIARMQEAFPDGG